MTEDEAAMMARLAVIATSDVTSRPKSNNWPGHANRLQGHERRVREYYDQHPDDPEAAAYRAGVQREERQTEK